MLCDAGCQVKAKSSCPSADKNGGNDLFGVRAFYQQKSQCGYANAARPKSIDWGKILNLYTKSPCGCEDEEICDEDREKHARK